MLENMMLLRNQAFIDGSWIDTDSRVTSPVRNPVDGSVLCFVPEMVVSETCFFAIKAAASALPAWQTGTTKDRARILYRWHDLILQAREDLVRLLTAEQGKPLAEAYSEIAYDANFIEWFAEEGKRTYRDVISSHAIVDKRIYSIKGTNRGCVPSHHGISLT